MSNKLVDKDGLMKYHKGVNTPSGSPILTNSFANKFKVGTSVDTHEDYTEQMEDGVVSLDDIAGVSFREEDKLVNLEIANLYTSKNSMQITPMNFLHVAYGDNHGYTFIDGRMELASNSGDKEISVTHVFDGLKDGYRYTVLCDLTKIGNPTFKIECCDVLGNTTNQIEYLSTQNRKVMITFVYSKNSGIGFRVFSATNVASGGGSVVLNDMKIVEHNPNTISPRVKLRSLPHGVSDWIRGNAKIKHVDSINLNGNEPWQLVDSSKTNTNLFKAKLANSFNRNYANAIVLNSNRYECVSYNTITTTDATGFAISADGCLMFAVSKGINTANKLKDHLRYTETDLVVEYECITTKEYVDLSIDYEKGDTLYIDSPIDVTSKHSVQFNTKLQTNTIQKTIFQKSASVLQKVASLFDGKVCPTPNGYIVLPSALGGLKLQWFVVEGIVPTNNQKTTVSKKYPIACSSWSRAFGSMRTASNGGYTEYRCSCTEGDDDASCSVEIRRDTAPGTDVNVTATVFVIGK